MDATGFSIGTKGYIGIGINATGNLLQDFWEWNQSTNVWTQTTNFGGIKRYGAVGFSIGNKGYVCTGAFDPATRYQDLWEWDQSSNAWTQKANFGGTGRLYSIGFSICLKGYVGTGAQSLSPYFTQDFWEWDQSTNMWTQKANFGAGTRSGAISFSIGKRGYVGVGDIGSPLKQDFWEFIPDDSSSCCNTPSTTITGNINIFQGQITTLTASGGTNYLWSDGETTTAITVSPPTTTAYCVTVSDTNICKDTVCATVFVESPCDTAGTFYFPNAFSPNKDGDNDLLKIYYTNPDCIKTLHLLIYNRWGQEVFETNDANFKWDGNYKDEILNTQVLAYSLSVQFTDGKELNKKGNISLVR